jgi:hypothetical protein
MRRSRRWLAIDHLLRQHRYTASVADGAGYGMGVDFLHTSDNTGKEQAHFTIDVDL